jgi:hypothetical protein
VLESLRNTKTFNVDLGEPLNVLERQWLVRSLGAKRGVRDARFEDDNPRRLVIEYDADLVCNASLFDFFDVCGVEAKSGPQDASG